MKKQYFLILYYKYFCQVKCLFRDLKNKINFPKYFKFKYEKTGNEVNKFVVLVLNIKKNLG